MSEEQPVVIVKNLIKTFQLPHEKNTGIKQAALNVFNRRRGFEKQKVLDDISFEIKKGEFFGIVGRNGGGKSTLLKLLAGIYAPDEGLVQVNGSLTPFIELGVGFNPELTGRENVFLNGALLGFSSSEMEDMYDEIVAFAEIEKFMDQKLKNYSSGMQVRLAFSIAIQARSDILLLDEVLAVGDEAFQRKCLDIFESYKAKNQTIILVTHDMQTVKRFCSRAILIDNGKLLFDGDPNIVADRYSKLNQDTIDKNSNVVVSEESDLKIDLKDNTGKQKVRFEYGDEIVIDLSWPNEKPVLNAGVSIYTSIGECVYATNTFMDKTPVKQGKNKASINLKLNIGAGKYYVMAGTFGDAPEKKVDFVTYGPAFHVNQERTIGGDGITRLEHKWHI